MNGPFWPLMREREDRARKREREGERERERERERGRESTNPAKHVCTSWDVPKTRIC
jgi:hypothetical protein